MAFIREELTEEQGKELQSKHGLINPGVITKDPYTPRLWAVDRDEYAYIFFTGAEGHGGSDLHLQYFSLFWKGQRADIEEYEKFDEPSNIYTRYVKSIRVPQGFLDNQTSSKLEALIEDGIVTIMRNLGNHKFKYVQLAEPQEIKQPSLIGG